MPTPRDRDELGGDIPRSTYLGVPRRFMQGITTVLVAALVNTALLPLTHAQQLQSAQASSGAGNIRHSGCQQPEAVARRTTDL